MTAHQVARSLRFAAKRIQDPDTDAPTEASAKQRATDARTLRQASQVLDTWDPYLASVSDRVSLPWPKDADMDLEDLLDRLAKSNIGNGAWVGDEVEPRKHVTADHAYPVHITQPDVDRDADEIVFQCYPDVARATVVDMGNGSLSINFPTRAGLNILDDMEPIVLEKGERPPVDTTYTDSEVASDPP